MNTITFGCSITRKESFEIYDYYLYSRIDNYVVIVRAKQDGTEYLFRIILLDENIDNVWNNREIEIYLRPDQLPKYVKKYIIVKTKAFVNSIGNEVERWK
jgi:hypothetical protein